MPDARLRRRITVGDNPAIRLPAALPQREPIRLGWEFCPTAALVRGAGQVTVTGTEPELAGRALVTREDVRHGVRPRGRLPNAINVASSA
jgi:hypothetical protein